MPYESFKSAHHVSIRGLVQDSATGSWRYLLQVTRHMEDDAFKSEAVVPRLSSDGGASVTSQSSQLSASTRHASLLNLNKSMPATTSFRARPCATQTYAIRRSFEDFKRLHEAVEPLMAASGSGSSANSRTHGKEKKSLLPKLPNDSLLTFFVGETQTALQKKRLALERMLTAIEAHPAASEAPEYLEFLANMNSYDLVSKAPLSPAISSRSSFSFSEDGGVTPRSDLGGLAASNPAFSRSANALRRAYFQQDSGCSASRRRRTAERDGHENHVTFSHFSMT